MFTTKKTTKQKPQGEMCAPWRVCPKNNRGSYDVEDSNGHYVALGIYEAEQAALIADAPRLREINRELAGALEAALPLLEEYSVLSNVIAGARSNVGIEEIKAVRSALARAKEAFE